MWSNYANRSKRQQTENLVLEHYTKAITYSKRETIKYKNRFLNKLVSFSNKNAGFFGYKGNKIKYIKIFRYANLHFFWQVKSIKTPSALLNKYNHIPYELNLLDYPLFLRALNSSDTFKNLDTLIPYYIKQHLPMVKAVCFDKKTKKTKKTKNKQKYQLKYYYVPHEKRVAVATRWFAMLVKFNSKPLVTSLLEQYIDVALNDYNSKLCKIRNQIYAGLTHEKD